MKTTSPGSWSRRADSSQAGLLTSFHKRQTGDAIAGPTGISVDTNEAAGKLTGLPPFAAVTGAPGSLVGIQLSIGLCWGFDDDKVNRCSL